MGGLGLLGIVEGQASGPQILSQFKCTVKHSLGEFCLPPKNFCLFLEYHCTAPVFLLKNIDKNENNHILAITRKSELKEVLAAH